MEEEEEKEKEEEKIPHTYGAFGAAALLPLQLQAQPTQQGTGTVDHLTLTLENEKHLPREKMNKAGYMAPWFCLGEQGPGVLNYFCPGSDHRHTCKCRKKSLTDGLMNRPIDRTLAIASNFNYNCQYMVLRNFSLIKFLFTSRRSMFVGVVFS